jgi:DNA gyrase subunit A
MGRATQGVRLINLKGNDSIAAVAKVKSDEDNIDDEDDTVDGTPVEGGTTASETTQKENSSEEEE